LLGPAPPCLPEGTPQPKAGMGTVKRQTREAYLRHPTGAFTPARVTGGVVGRQGWQRPEQPVAQQRTHHPMAEQESARWLEGYHGACKLKQACPAPGWFIVPSTQARARRGGWPRCAESQANGPRVAGACHRRLAPGAVQRSIGAERQQPSAPEPRPPQGAAPVAWCRLTRLPVTDVPRAGLGGSGLAVGGKSHACPGCASQGGRWSSCAGRRSREDGMPERCTGAWLGVSTPCPWRAGPLPRRPVRSSWHPRSEPPCIRCSLTATRLRPRPHAARWYGVLPSSAGSEPGRETVSPGAKPSGRVTNGCTSASMP
jgi:hypothetical protein